MKRLDKKFVRIRGMGALRNLQWVWDQLEYCVHTIALVILTAPRNRESIFVGIYSRALVAPAARSIDRTRK